MNAPFPFMAWDVVVVHVACSVPLAFLLAAWLSTRISTVVAGAVAVFALGIGIFPWLPATKSALFDLAAFEPNIGLLLRAASALGLALAAFLLFALALGGRSRNASTPAVWLMGILSLFLLPLLYLNARSGHDIAKLGEAIREQRVGDARTLAESLVALDSGLKWNDMPLPKVREEIEQSYRKLTERVARPLPANAGTPQRLERATYLAMLGRGNEAMEVLKELDDPEADNLRGSIHENDGDWPAALAAFRKAEEAWKARPASPMRDAGLQRAVAGVAYSLRKSGRYAEAEQAYDALLSLAPTADTHFLLAQFHQDSQQAAKAAEHARQAMALDPKRYEVQGKRLIDRLAMHQFGCFRVFEGK